MKPWASFSKAGIGLGVVHHQFEKRDLILVFQATQGSCGTENQNQIPETEMRGGFVLSSLEGGLAASWSWIQQPASIRLMVAQLSEDLFLCVSHEHRWGFLNLRARTYEENSQDCIGLNSLLRVEVLSAQSDGWRLALYFVDRIQLGWMRAQLPLGGQSVWILEEEKILSSKFHWRLMAHDRRGLRFWCISQEGLLFFLDSRSHRLQEVVFKNADQSSDLLKRTDGIFVVHTQSVHDESGSCVCIYNKKEHGFYRLKDQEWIRFQSPLSEDEELIDVSVLELRDSIMVLLHRAESSDQGSSDSLKVTLSPMTKS